MGGISGHTEDAVAPGAQQGCALSLPSPPKVEGAEMAQQKPSESGSHGEGAACKEPVIQGSSFCQRKAAQSRAGEARIHPAPSLCSSCQLLPPERQSQWEASRQGRQQADCRSEPPGRRAEKGVGWMGGMRQRVTMQ